MEAAERLKISVENLNSMLTTSLQKISDKKKRTRKLKAVSTLRKRRKKKEMKLEVPSMFKKSVKAIKLQLRYQIEFATIEFRRLKFLNQKTKNRRDL